MNIIEAQNLACPIDGEKLSKTDKQFVCKNGHSFDIARQGYVNLLPVQHKRSKQPGDSKAMVQARSQFLNSGVYEAIADKLTLTVLTHIINDNALCLLDAGCGEGYYFDFLLNKLRQQEGVNALSFIGLDISKDAIAQATKRNKLTSWVVGTNRQPPVADESVDIIICMFGFFCEQGFYKVLKPGGKIIMVDPGTKHLKELREIIYDEIKKTKSSDVLQFDEEKFSLLSSEALQFETVLSDNEQINQLLLMTPHFYRASKAGREAACKLDRLDLTVDVVLKTLQKL